jgi:hypothetical protein
VNSGSVQLPRRALPRSALAGAAVLVLAIAATAPAVAAEAPIQADVVDLSFRAQRPVPDRILKRAPRVARSAALTSTQYVDTYGNPFTIVTDQDGLDTKPYADILTSVVHGSEISNLEITVTNLAGVQALCGAQAAACYFPMRDGHGRIYLAHDYTDWVHTTIHEYGHHVDNQLLNFAHLFGTCDISGDGSRNWFFERFYGKRTPKAEFSCDPGSSWDQLLPELFAEDYSWLNGMRNWVLETAVPPSEVDVEAMRSDIVDRFEPTVKRTRTKRVAPRRSRTIRIEAGVFTFLELKLRGPRGTNFDLYLYERGKKRPSAYSRRRGSRETLRVIVTPGTYLAVIGSRAGSGRATLTVGLY